MTVTQVHLMATDTTPLKPPALTVPSRRRQPKTPPGHDGSGTPEDDLALGIFEDDAECDDLTDSEAECDVTTGMVRVIHGDDGTHPLEDREARTDNNNHVKIEVSISRRSKVKDDVKPTLTEVSLTMTPRSDRSEESYHQGGFRAKTNTPVSLLSDRSEAPTSDDRQSQGGGSASREAMFQQALTLMSQRCVSVVHHSKGHHANRHTHHPDIQGPVVYPLLQPPPTAALPSTSPRLNQRLTPRGTAKSVPVTTSRRQHPADVKETSRFSHRYIYVNQTRPSPMPPLKMCRSFRANIYVWPTLKPANVELLPPREAWRGFSGNVYFEPIKVKSVSQGDTAPPGEVKVTRGYHYGGKLPGMVSELSAGPLPDGGDGILDGIMDPAYTQGSPAGPTATFKSQFKVHKVNSMHKRANKLVIVDKGTVYSPNFDNLMMSDDIEWVVGGGPQHQQDLYAKAACTGSLVVQAPPPPDVTYSKSLIRGGAGGGGLAGGGLMKENSKKLQYNRERICRGSVAHRAFPLKDLQDIGAAFTAKSVTSPNSRISPLNHNTTDKEDANTKTVAIESTLEPTSNAKLPPLDPATTTPRSKPKGVLDNVHPLASIALSSEQMKNSSTMHHPHPQGKPYVKYSRTSVK